MRKTAEAISTSVMEKYALRRAGKELRSIAESLFPGFSRKYKSSLSRNNTLLNAVLGEGGGLMGKDTPRVVEQIRKQHPAFLAAVQPPANRAAAEMTVSRRNALAGVSPDKLHPFANTDVRRGFSGRHLARKEEFVIPAAGSPEMISSPRRGRDAVVFRGNKVPESLDAESAAFLATRHPDVAAGYATGGAMNYGPVDRVLQVFRRKGLKGIETRADAYGSSSRPGGLLREGARRNVGGEVEVASSSGKKNPTYEMVVSGKRKPHLLAEYAVRETRTPSGDPAYALKHMTGEKPERIFR